MLLLEWIYVFISKNRQQISQQVNNLLSIFTDKNRQQISQQVNKHFYV